MQFSSSLKLNHIFRRLYRKGQSAANGYLVLYCHKNGSRQNRIGLTVSAKLALVSYAWEEGIPILSSMGTGNKLHPEAFRIGDIYSTSVCPLCRVMRRELKKREIPALKVLYSEETPRRPETPGETKGSGRPAPASIAFVPPVAGLLIAGEVIRELSGTD